MARIYRVTGRPINGHRIAPPPRFERVITCDARIPLSDDDREMECGWRCIPIPPTDDPHWFILDDSSDHKTVWGRAVDDAEDGA
jgi:hypothetical protein